MASGGRTRKAKIIREKETVAGQIPREDFQILLWASADEASPDRGRTRSVIIAQLVRDYCAGLRERFIASGGPERYRNATDKKGKKVTA